MCEGSLRIQSAQITLGSVITSSRSGETEPIPSKICDGSAGNSGEHYLVVVAGLYPQVAAFFIASIPSSTVSSGVVLTALQAPPAPTATEKAAALMLSGISMTPIMS